VKVSRSAVRWAALLLFCFITLLLAAAVALSGGEKACTFPVTALRYERPTCSLDHHFVAIGVAVVSGLGTAASLVVLSRTLRHGGVDHAK